MTDLRRAVLLFLAGMALVQAAWVLALPPYRGVDEFDHAYRTASLAHGQLRPLDEPVDDGRGDYVRVPRSVVRDAGPVCSTYAYTGPDNCFPAADLDGDFVKVASAAARYNPVYYGIAGSVAREFDGAGFVYAARVATVAMCLALWGLAGLCAIRARRPRAMLFAMAVAVTPVLSYSGSIVAPNGVEIAAAVACWCSLLALDNAQSRRDVRLLLIIAAVSGCLLALLRTAGPLWLLLIVLTVLALPGRRTRLGNLREHGPLVLATISAVAAATAGSLWWVLTTRTNSLSEEAVYSFADPWLNSLQKVVLWVFQSIAAFPTRGEEAPTVVYALVLAALTACFIALGRWSDRRWRLTLLAMLGIWLVPPYVFTGLTYVESGAIWQGRYSLPYSVGIPLVLLAWGVAKPHTGRSLVPALTALCYAAATVVSIANVRRGELANSPLAGDDRWITAPELTVVVLAVGGTLLMFSACMVRRTQSPGSVPAGSRAQSVSAE